MRTRSGVVLVILLVTSLAPLVPFAVADTVIGAEGVELLGAGDFSDSEEWQISSTAGFSNDVADHSLGMVADGELSFTHDRPDNFQYSTSWASNSITNSNATLGEPDSYYTWSKGPNITMTGYDFSGLHGMLVANVSLVLHFSIPDVLNQDSVRVILQNHGSDKLVVTYARTFGPIYRMTNPMVLSLDGLALADWSSLEDTQFTIDITKQVYPSIYEIDDNVATKKFSVGARQAFDGGIEIGLRYFYEFSGYQPTLNAGALRSRTEDLQSLQLSLGKSLNLGSFDDAQVSIFYNQLVNESTKDYYDFERNQYGIQLKFSL